MSEELFLHTAVVLKTDDEDKKGRVQIKILPEMEKAKDFPWAMPFLLNSSENTISMDLPDENSVIRVLRDSTWKRFYYLPNRYFTGLFDFSKVSDIFDDKSLENVDTEYKNIHFRMYTDGTLIFHNNSDGSHGIIQSTGSYVVLNADGTVLSNIQKDIKVNQEGDTEYTQKGNLNFTIDKEIHITGKDILEILLDKAFTFKGKDVCDMIFDKDYTVHVDSGHLLEFGNQVSTLGKILVELMEYLADLITIGPPTIHTSPKLTGEMTHLIAKTRKVFKC